MPMKDIASHLKATKPFDLVFFLQLLLCFQAKKLEQARDLLKEACDIPDNDSLKISQSLERIFLQSSSLRREKLSKRTSKAVRKARDLLKEAFDITNDHSLKISRSLEVIFLHNNQREIPIPPAPEEPKEVSFLCLFFLKLFLLF